MFFKNYHLMFLTTLFLGTLTAVSSNSWFTSWLGLEINLMSMIPLMIISLNKKFTEAAIKYFMAQAMASILLIMSIILHFFFNENILLNSTELFVIVSLSIKGGLAPFHFWFPQVSNLLNWSQCLILFTWQKIAPLLLLFSLNLNILFLLSSASAVTGALGGFNQNLVKLIMTYSSIGHSGWMLMGCALSINSWILYFSIYSFLSITILSFFKTNQIIKNNQIFTCSDSKQNKMILIMNMLSLGGLPPLMGFLAKLTILMISISMKLVLIFVPLILSSVVSLFFYARLIYSNLMNNSLKSKSMVYVNKPPTNLLFTSSIFFNLLFPVFSLMT